MTNATRNAVTIATARLNGMTEAQLNRAVAAWIETDNASSATGVTLICQSLCFLVVENNPDPINAMLSRLTNTATVTAVVDLVRWASAYKIEKVELADEQGADKITSLTFQVLNKEKGSKKKRQEIQTAADANFERFMTRFNGDVWNWVKHVDDKAKADRLAAKEDRKKEKLAKMTDDERQTEIKTGLYKKVDKLEGLSDATIAEIKRLIAADLLSAQAETETEDQA